MNRLLYSLHWLNLDTAIGAVITSLFIADFVKASVPLVAVITLFIAVLAIYNFDHLMDARRLNSVARTARHRFYQENLRALSIYQLMLMIGLMTIIWYLPADILRAGLVLALITGIYFILLFFIFPGRFTFKEIMIALVYTLALFLAPLYTLEKATANLSWLILWVEILLLALSNTLIFAWYDHEIDHKEGHASLARNLNRQVIYRMVIGFLIILYIISAYSIVKGENLLYQGVILLMTTTLLFSLLGNQLLQKKERYRIVGDAIFIIPIIILLL